MSMRVTDGFRAFVLEQLAGVEFVRARALFGGCRLVTVIDRFHYVTRASSGWAVILDCAEGRHFNLNPCPETTAGGFDAVLAHTATVLPLARKCLLFS